MKRILLVDDFHEIHQLISEELGQEFSFSMATSIAQATDLLEDHEFDLIVLDVMLPDGNGFSFLQELRKKDHFNNVPVIFLTGLAQIDNKVKGLTLGAEDYVTKPFSIMELRARIIARLKEKDQLLSQTWIRKGNIRLNIGLHKAFLIKNDEEQDLQLTSLEFRLLTFFLAHLDETLGRDKLISEIWGNDIHVIYRTVDTHVSNLRRKLTSDSQFTIKSIHGVGYIFTRSKNSKHSLNQTPSVS